MVGGVGVDQGREEPGLAPGPGADEGVHGPGAAQDAQDEDRLDGAGVAEAQEAQQPLRDEVAEGAVDVEEGVAVAEGEVRAPARPPDAILDHPVELEEEVDVVASVVGPPEIAGQEERSHREEGQRQGQPEETIPPEGQAEPGGLDAFGDGLSGHRAPPCRPRRRPRAGGCRPASRRGRSSSGGLPGPGLRAAPADRWR